MTMQYLPLSALQPSAANVRKTFRTDSIEELAQCILTDGLLQNLVVHELKGDGSGYTIISGERRYRALKLLVERGQMEANALIPVEIRDGLSAQDSHRLATVENVQREDLPPLEEAEAVAGLIQNGQTLADVSAKTGLSVNTIKRRLALVNLTDAVKEALQSGELTLGQAEALTLGSPEEQERILERILDGYYCDPGSIRDLIVDAKPSVAFAIFPVEQYTGTFTSDLFGEDDTTYFDDAEQFFDLQKQAVDALAERHRETAAWVEVTENYSITTWRYDEAEDGQPGGVVINFAPTGRVEVAEGLIRRETIDWQTAAEAQDNPLAPQKPKPAYSRPLCEYMAMHKSVAVQHELLSSPRKTREVAVITMLGAYDWTAGIKADPHPSLRYFNLDANHSPVYERIEAAVREVLALIGIACEEDGLAWYKLLNQLKDAVKTYEAVKALSDEQLDRLFTVIVALTFGQGDTSSLDTGESLFNRVAADLGVAMREHWMPDMAFLTRRNKPQLIEIAQACGAAAYTSAISTYKKGELVSVLTRHFEEARDAAEPNEHQIKAQAWLPEAMHFPAAEPDAKAHDDGDEADFAEAAE